MNQDSFVNKHEALWQQFENWLVERKKKPKHREPSNYRANCKKIPHLYRQLCHHLSLAQARQYSPHLVARLNHLVLQGHQYLYQSRINHSKFFHFLFVGFPKLLRQQIKLFAFASALFYIPFLAIVILINQAPEMVYSVMSPEQVSNVQAMYKPSAEHFGRSRTADNNLQMFGLYIYNNITISFQTFASGMLLCMGSLFFLIFNGLYIGAVFGHLIEIGYSVTILSFVAGHSALELTAIVISGAAGMRLGLALINPGRNSRIKALKEAGNISIRLMYGVFLMLVAAAFVEAFWSSQVTIPVVVKYTVGISMWCLLAAYFIFVGRGHEY